MSNDYFHFFSYGSNLLFERIVKRVPSVEVIQLHRLDQFELVFNKRSIDRSTKANMRKARAESYLYGVIHKIHLREKADLDKAEGLGMGYELDFFESELDGEIVSIGYYIAKDPDYLTQGRPYDWYLDYVKFGAKENQFPEGYLDNLNSVLYQIDLDNKRREEHDKVLNNYR